MNFHGESGHGVLELAVSLVVLLPLIMLPFGFSHVLSIRESLSNLSREAANIAHRECKTLAKDQFIFQRCLGDAAEKVRVSGNNTLGNGNLSVLISTFEYLPSISPSRARVSGGSQGLTINRAASGNRFLTKYGSQKVLSLFHQRDLNNVRITAPIGSSVLEEKQIVAIAEVRYLETSPLGILTPSSLSPEYREVTVY